MFSIHKSRFFVCFLILLFFLNSLSLPAFAKTEEHLMSVEEGIKILVKESIAALPDDVTSIGVLNLYGVTPEQYDRNFLMERIVKELKKTERFQRIVDNNMLRQTIQYLPPEDKVQDSNLSIDDERWRIANILDVDSFLYPTVKTEDKVVTLEMSLIQVKTQEMIYKNQMKVRDDIPRGQAKILILVIAALALAFTADTAFGHGPGRSGPREQN